ALSKDVLKGARESGNSLKISIGDGSTAKKTLYEWTFSKENLKSSETLKDLDLSLSIQSVKTGKDTEAGKIINSIQKEAGKKNKQIMKDSIICSLGNNGELGCEAEVKMYVGDYAKKNESYYLYYANSKTGKLEEVPCKPMKAKDGFLNAKIKHCSDYVFVEGKLSADVATPLAEQVRNIKKSKKIEAGKTFTIQPVLPSTLKKAAKITRKDGADMEVVITYHSSDKKIATVGKCSGIITGKKKGSCIITTKILLADGSQRNAKTKIVVK
ncbi:MAG: hypothetical protein MR357_09290, partial [Anaeroplasma sp.]|nr:hypothetical protein [Anaeroplasma sp.]